MSTSAAMQTCSSSRHCAQAGWGSAVTLARSAVGSSSVLLWRIVWVSAWEAAASWAVQWGLANEGLRGWDADNCANAG